MDLDWLQDIICLENSRSFTQAARERNITQPALSRRVKSLEAWLDTPLIDRTSYPIRLTRAGETFLPIARQMVVQLQQTREDIRESGVPEARTIRIAAPHSIASNFLARRLAEMFRADPELRTRVHSDNAVVCFDLFSQGYCELLLTYRHPAIPMALDPDRFICRDLAAVRLLPVAEPQALRDGGWTLPGTSHAPTPLLTYDRESFLGGVVAHVLGSRAGPLHLKTLHVDAFAEAIKALCLGGAGIAWLPEPLVREELASGALVELGDPGWQSEMQLSLYAAVESGDADLDRFCAALAP